MKSVSSRTVSRHANEYRKAKEMKNRAYNISNSNRPNTRSNSSVGQNSEKYNDVNSPSCTEAQTVLLCLDYLRSLRRNNHGPRELLEMEGMNGDYVTLAIWALSRCFDYPEELARNDGHHDVGDNVWLDPTNSAAALMHRGNDPYFQCEVSDMKNNMKSNNIVTHLTKEIAVPTMEQMNDEILYQVDPRKMTGEGRDELSPSSDAGASSLYEYNDGHYSNLHRFYKHEGLGSQPLELQELVMKGLQQTKGMSRGQGEDIMVQDHMFTDFMDAVKAKGFFEISHNDVMKRGGDDMNPLTSKHKKEVIKEKMRKERYRKVVSKFRYKLVENGLEDESESKQDINGNVDDEATVTGSVVGAMESAKENGTLQYDDIDSISRKSNASNHRRMSLSTKTSRKDIEEAEQLKITGNSFMQEKKYDQAKECYTKALEIAPAGPTSHVYYSNRAAALLSMRNFTEAVWDAERSVALKPDYPKAYARLGLAHFLLGQYKEAVKSYALAVKFEPNNQTSVSYLDRSKKKLTMVNRSNSADADDDKSTSSRRSMANNKRASVSRSGSRRYSTIQQVGSHDSEDSAYKKRSVRSGHTKNSRSQRGQNAEEKIQNSYDLAIESNNISNENIDEANRLKVEGNKAMARKNYAEAIKLYSKALRLAPAGPQSHVFFSNRAAALCYLERYEEAELDAERALALDPEFGKAHARLGLARYFLKDYHGAVEAYECAGTYDPDNESNRIYLAKAKLKLGRRQSVANNPRE